MEDRAIRGTSDWTRYEVILPVFEDSQMIVFGVLLCGTGQLWLRDIHIDVVISTNSWRTYIMELAHVGLRRAFSRLTSLIKGS